MILFWPARRSPIPRPVGVRSALSPGLAGVAALLSTTFLTGCWSYSPGDTHLPRPVAPEARDQVAWPPRDLAPVVELMERTPAVIRYNRVADGVEPASISEADRKILDEYGDKVVYKGIHGLGLMRLYEPLKVSENSTATRSLLDIFNFMSMGFTPNAFWLTSRTLEGAREARGRFIELPESEAEIPGIVQPPFDDLPRSSLVVDDSVADLHLRSGMAIRFPPQAVPKKPYIGVVLHLNAMFGNEYEVRTLDVFREHGWAVIDLKPTSQVLSPIPRPWHEVIRQSLRRRQELVARICTDITGSPRYIAHSVDDYSRMTERFHSHPLASEVEYLSRLIDRCQSGAYIASSPETYADIAERVASELDQAQAGSAYACEAVLDYVAKHRPDLSDLPIVLIGFSAGGLAAPTSAARIADRLDAVVIIGGGADCLTASQRSIFSNGGVTIRTTADEPLEDRKLSLKQIRELSRLYLSSSRLDPYHTAPLLASLPVLLVTGTDDSWVPSECGDLLWQRLGRPDRLEISAGHELLFYFLPDRAQFIEQWVEEHLRSARQPSSPGYASARGDSELASRRRARAEAPTVIPTTTSP